MTLYIGLAFGVYFLLSDLLKFDLKLLKINIKRNSYHQFVKAIRGNISGETEIPPFLFYGEIVEKLLILKRKFGVPIQLAIRELRKSARISFKSEKEIQQELLGFYMQYIMIAGFTWFFLFHLEKSLGIQFPLLMIQGLVVWQVLGALLFTAIFYLVKFKKLNSFRDVFLCLYLFRSLILTSRPISEVVEVSNINNLRPRKGLKILFIQIYELLSYIKNYGKVSSEEFDLVILEAWDCFEEEVEKFKKLIAAVKLLFIMFFVFTGFLFVIFLSLKSFNL